jgi:hypothetical protein
VVVALFLAHVLGDYIFQWDGLAIWKSKSPRGVLVHSAIVLGTTGAIALAIDSGWWPYVLFIGLSHLVIDMTKTVVIGPLRPIPMLGYFLLDQAAHLFIIVAALVHSSYLSLNPLAAAAGHGAPDSRLLVIILGYALITVPTRVFIRFLLHALCEGLKADPPATFGNRYASYLERGAITTAILLGQFPLLPLAVASSLLFEGFQARKGGLLTGRLVEQFISISLAVAVGLYLISASPG